MVLSNKAVWFIIFIVCLSIIYSIKQNINIGLYTGSFIHDHEKSRINFLNNTFCGKFISGTWKKIINSSDILKHKQSLQPLIRRSVITYKKLSCAEFVINNGFYSKSITDLEYNNPMVFSILVYKHFYQFQVLMRTLYVRSNFHCIHVDRDALPDFYSYALKLSECLDNVYVVHPRRAVSWGSMNILKAERLCQIYLLKQSSTWHYYMTIAGTELPIQTNLNRVQILQLVPDKSRNDVSSFPQPYNRQASKKIPPPGNMTVYKGEFHSILTREFIQAVHTNPLALELWSFLNGTRVPDEHFYTSLVRLPQFPGGKSRVVPTYVYQNLLSHYKVWFNRHDNMCQSLQYNKRICQFNYKDLEKIEESGRLFANKFNQDLDLVGIDCWEQWLKIKQDHHQDIEPRKYIDKYPFTRREPHISDNGTITG